MAQDGSNKIMASTVFGSVAGFFTGSISSVWAEPALKRTSPLSVGSKGMGIIAGQTALFAAVGGVFASGTVVSSTIRGKDDMWNQAIGACAAGGVVGARFASAPTAIIACPLFAFTSIMVDLSGKTFRPSREKMAIKHAQHLAAYDSEVRRSQGQ
mmetsp:Transcript_13697/g.11409  ORF Transcript_13697/g.11409 Transcript_13697/m.11409 type:complete len:155 (+) Transcript_13697:31-495(+)|eukprot:CAMPEP_0179441496 /NCGR_PEP_ID=MMETSP0799-20121207/25042_1 /TAXON_ID=46947 /ORGANISM="Geminigera cryophila, Strain CCMP2564" /LENGTH=154 /DNA_ID=CAMNT_0021225797 /DNA_START=28 /DNA_END=492 /DNA_ORIENTATION=-